MGLDRSDYYMDYRILFRQSATMLANFRELEKLESCSWHLHRCIDDVSGAGLV